MLEIQQKVDSTIHYIMRDKISCDQIKPNINLVDDLHAESIELMEIFLTLMSDFDIEFDQSVLAETKTLNDLYIYIDTLLKQKTD